MCSAIMAKSYAGNHLLVILVCIYFGSNLYIPECCPGVSTDSILVSIKIIVNQSGYRIRYSMTSYKIVLPYIYIYTHFLLFLDEQHIVNEKKICACDGKMRIVKCSLLVAAIYT